ncbi:MAG: hypothetical protein KY460_05540 [Actinobacteria bacterium]|nr:hypothetical protein [Actinomycetota bacterium]
MSAALAANTDDRIVSIGDVIRAVRTVNGGYPINTVYKTIQRLAANTEDDRSPTVLERIDRHRLRVRS